MSNSSTEPSETASTALPDRLGLIGKLWKLATSRLMLSVGAQAMVSGFHFGLNLVLLRLLTPYDYGIFAFAFVLAMFASAINNALISTPLTVYTPVLKDQNERAEQEAMFSTLNILLFLALILCGVIYAFTTEMASDISLSVTVFVAVYAARQYSRSFGYARLRPLVTATGDIIYVVTGIIIVALIAWLSPSKTTVTAMLLSLAAANGFAMLSERFNLHGKSKQWLTMGKLSNYGDVWKQSKWALLGAVTTLFLAQAHSLIITSTFGPNAFAPLAAGMVLFGPVRVALLTWQNMVKPELAMALADNRGEFVKKQIRQTCLFMGAAVFALGLALMMAWPFIHQHLYAEKYADQPMGFIVSMWAAITFFAAVYNAPSAALQAMRDFRVLAMSSVYGAILSGIVVSVLLFFVSPASTLIGILAAECFMAVYLIRVMLSHLKEEK